MWPSGKYPDYPESFQSFRKISRLSGSFPDHPENIQPIRKLSRLSGNFPDNPENIWKFSKWSRNSLLQFPCFSQINIEILRFETFHKFHVSQWSGMVLHSWWEVGELQEQLQRRGPWMFQNQCEVLPDSLPWVSSLSWEVCRSLQGPVWVTSEVCIFFLLGERSAKG